MQIAFDPSRFKNLSMGVCKDDPERFAREKWDRLNVYNTAAYYVYLMRFGQLTNSEKIFLTEDGGLFYQLDNDMLGLLNSGQLEGEPNSP